MASVGGLLAWMLWCACAGAAALGVWRHDALVAVTFEAVTGPFGFALLHLPVAIGWDVARRIAARWVPRLSGAVAPLLPLAVLVTVWIPGIFEPTARPAGRTAQAASGQDVVLITLDTFRADHTGVIGGTPLTPSIDTLAARGAVFTQAITTSPVTAPAHASMLTGLDVPRHQLYSNGASVKVDTFVEAVRLRGMRTGAFVSAHVVNRETRLVEGFQHFDDRWGFGQRLSWLPFTPLLKGLKAPPRRSGAETVDQALRWLYADDAPAFLWVQLFDAHGPYSPPSEFQPSAAAIAEAKRLDREDLRAHGDPSVVGWTARTRVRENSLYYQASVRWVDALVGRLVGRLRGDPIVIVVADHGESLGEHGQYFRHGGTLWEQAIHVPMVVRWPGRFEGGQRIPDLVSVRAVAPLVLQAIGQEPVTPVSPERNVLVYTTGQESLHGRTPPRDENFKARQAAAFRYDGGKLLAPGGEPVVWYDLKADPGELAPLPVPVGMEADAATLTAIVEAPPPRLSEHQRRRLEAIGYVE